MPTPMTDELRLGAAAIERFFAHKAHTHETTIPNVGLAKQFRKYVAYVNMLASLADGKTASCAGCRREPHRAKLAACVWCARNPAHTDEFVSA